MGLVGIWVRPECRCSLSGSAHLTLVNFDRCNYLPKHFMKGTDVPYKMFSTSFAFISYVPIGPADPWDSIHFRPDPWDHGPMSGLFLHRLLLRYCYTPTLVWAVTIEMQITPPYWVGGWAAPKVGWLLEKTSKTFLILPVRQGLHRAPLATSFGSQVTIGLQALRRPTHTPSTPHFHENN